MILHWILAAMLASTSFIPPSGALRWRNTLIREVHYTWGLGESPSTFFGQVAQESSWNPNARSQFAAGLTQFTPATAAGIAGTSRLRELCAEQGGCPLDPHWALRAMVMYDRDIWNGQHAFSGDERIAAMLVGYNGGAGWVTRERTVCARVSGCDPARWFGHVEQHCVRAHWACIESRYYPDVILHKWKPLYQNWLAR